MLYSNNFAASAATVLVAASAVAAVPFNAPWAPLNLTTVTQGLNVSSGAFKVHQQPNPKFQGRNGPAALAKALAKYGAPIPSNVLKAATRSGLVPRSSGSVVATPTEYDSEYIVPVEIGTPAQTLNLDFDSGSSDLWVFSSETASSDVDGQTTYKIGKSTTATKDTGATWSISYGDGSSSSGNVYYDVVKVGGVSVTKQAVEAAETVSSEFTSDTSSDGLLGLAFSSINTVSPTSVKTWFDNAKSALDSPLWTANLKAGVAGNYNFGYIDSSEYTGTLHYVDVSTSNGFWEFTGTGYKVGTGTYKTASIDGIADTGTTLLLLPAAIVKAYWSTVTGAKNSNSEGGWIFPCSTSLPKFTFGIGTYRGVISGAHLNYSPISTGSSTCYGGLQSNAGIGFSIYGDVMFKSQFVVFDSGNTRLGFAAKA